MDAPEPDELTPAQQRAATYLAMGVASREAARRLGVAEQTIARWKGLAAFGAAVVREGERIDAAVRAEVEASGRDLREAKREALGVVRGHLQSENATVALRAAEILLKA